MVRSRVVTSGETKRLTALLLLLMLLGCNGGTNPEDAPPSINVNALFAPAIFGLHQWTTWQCETQQMTPLRVGFGDLLLKNLVADPAKPDSFYLALSFNHECPFAPGPYYGVVVRGTYTTNTDSLFFTLPADSLVVDTSGKRRKIGFRMLPSPWRHARDSLLLRFAGEGNIVAPYDFLSCLTASGEVPSFRGGEPTVCPPSP
jgi:hypothetical protein